MMVMVQLSGGLKSWNIESRAHSYCKNNVNTPDHTQIPTSFAFLIFYTVKQSQLLVTLIEINRNIDIVFIQKEMKVSISLYTTYIHVGTQTCVTLTHTYILTTKMQRKIYILCL